MMNEYFTNLAYIIFGEYGIFMFASIFATIAYRMRNYMTAKKLFKHLISSLFVSLIVGIIIRNFTTFVEEVLFIISAVAAYFSIEILTEIKEVINAISDYIKSFVESKLKIAPKQEKTPIEDINIDDINHEA